MEIYKPFDIVSDKDGNVGYINEVSVNTNQPDLYVQYSIRWLVGNQTKCSWWNYNELESHCNLFVEFAKNQCHPFGNNAKYVEKIFNNEKLEL